LIGAGWLAGIGFTMSLFIAQLAFVDPEMVEQAKLGIFLGSSVSAVIGLTWLSCVGSARRNRA
jgi:NhaA family Na+:H+ antiporter